MAKKVTFKLSDDAIQRVQELQSKLGERTQADKLRQVLSPLIASEALSPNARYESPQQFAAAVAGVLVGTIPFVGPILTLAVLVAKTIPLVAAARVSSIAAERAIESLEAEVEDALVEGSPGSDSKLAWLSIAVSTLGMFIGVQQSSYTDNELRRGLEQIHNRIAAIEFSLPNEEQPASDINFYLTRANAHIRTRPSNNSPTVGTIDEGTLVQVVEQDGAWIYILPANSELANLAGWVDREDLSR